MFTIKLVQGKANSSTHVLSCAHYSVAALPSHTEITLYKDFTTQNGVTYTISSEDIGRPYFDKCYIENVNGKTIDTLTN